MRNKQVLGLNSTFDASTTPSVDPTEMSIASTRSKSLVYNNNNKTNHEGATPPSHIPKHLLNNNDASNSVRTQIVSYKTEKYDKHFYPKLDFTRLFIPVYNCRVTKML